MGIINMTPDSFSGDGISYKIDQALRKAIEFEKLGADIIDVGGESTRPKHSYGENAASIVSEEEELERVLPLISKLYSEISIPVSIDTYKAKIAKAAVEEGASMVNDISGLNKGNKMLEVILDKQVPIVIVHNQSNTNYTDMVTDIIIELKEKLNSALSFGIDPKNLILDPGIGFGKKLDQNLELLRRLEEFKVLGKPILVGTSRKSNIGDVLGLPVNDRLEGTAATVALSIANGADIVRVHDVKEMVRVTRMADAIVRGID